MTAAAPARETTVVFDEAGERERLTRTWSNERRGIVGWLSEVDHRVIGVRFVVTAFVFFLLGGVEALLMRLQLATPQGNVLSADEYDQLFSTHGSTMMFLFAVPVMQGVGTYVVPLMLGTRNVAFPRLNAYAYFTYLTGGLLLYAALFTNTGVDAGWFAYVPLSGPQFSAGKRVDIWAQMITFTEISALSTATNLITTTFKHRAPGMGLDRMPLFVWAMLVTSFMVIFAMPAIMLASGCLALDRLVGTHFFNPAEGGDAFLWQHLFWFFGHPEVYIIFIPGLGMVSTIVATFTRREIVGYVAMVCSLVATAFVAFGLWVHHMFATGLPQLGHSFFTAASTIIALPTGVQFFCWIATIWMGERRLATPFLYVLGFFGVFLIGGLTGVMLASVPIDLQVHDTFFVVAHLHYVLIGGAIFPLFGALHYWFPKVTGRMTSEALGRVSFALVFVGFNLTFFPMHMLGMRGMTRRIWTYLPDTGWGPLNMLATVGAFVLGLGVLALIVNVIVSARSGKLAGDDPWGASSLEWATSSPPPPYAFLRPPTVRGRYARWSSPPDQPWVHGLKSDRREVLVTTLVDAEPHHKKTIAGPSMWPFWAAIATAITFIVSIVTPWGAPLGALFAAPAFAGWFWPKGKPTELAK